MGWWSKFESAHGLMELGRCRWMGVLLFHSVVSSRLLWLLDRMSMHKYWCVLVSGQIYLDHCFEFGCMGQWDVVAEIYSGGYILFCIERQIGAVIVVFLTSASQVYFVCVWHLLCDGGHVLRIGLHFYMYFFQSVDIIFVCGFLAIAPYSNFGLTSML